MVEDYSFGTEMSTRITKIWNSDIRMRDSYGAANRCAAGMWMNQGGESPVYLV